MRVRDRYERRGGSMDDVSVPPCLSDDRRSANRVVEEQVLLLRQMGFSKAHAEAYADAELQLHVILDVMCDDGVEGEDPPPPGPVARAMSRLLRAVTWSRKQKKRDTEEESDDETWTPAPDFAVACGPELNRGMPSGARMRTPGQGRANKKLIAAAPETWKKMPVPRLRRSRSPRSWPWASLPRTRPTPTRPSRSTGSSIAGADGVACVTRLHVTREVGRRAPALLTRASSGRLVDAGVEDADRGDTPAASRIPAGTKRARAFGILASWTKASDGRTADEAQREASVEAQPILLRLGKAAAVLSQQPSERAAENEANVRRAASHVVVRTILDEMAVARPFCAPKAQAAPVWKSTSESGDRVDGVGPLYTAPRLSPAKSQSRGHVQLPEEPPPRRGARPWPSRCARRPERAPAGTCPPAPPHPSARRRSHSPKLQDRAP